MGISNFEAWQLYNREVTSPQNFVDFGFYYLIAASLQRRIWRGPDHRKLYPNQYPILVGDPGVGKGLIIKQVAEFLNEHKLRPGGEFKAIDTTAPSASLEIAKEAIQSANFAIAANGAKHKIEEEPLLIPVAANATTFEALTGACARATRTCVYRAFDHKLGKKREYMYRHASLCFCLEEISSLFHKEAAKVVNFLITAYDCGDYTYDTKTAGTDYIKGVCLNFFGGTTPGFIEASFSDKLLSEGFSSRTWFIHAQRNRKYDLWSPQLTEEQIAAKKQISEHIKKLTQLYGEIKFSQESIDWLRSWWKHSNESPDYVRPNTADKLNPYYSRKDIHAQKLAIAMHCGEDAAMNEDGGPLNEIQLPTCKRAMSVLDNEERTMHLALNFDGANPLHRVGKRILTFLKKNGPHQTDQILMEFWSEANREELTTVLDHLRLTKQIHLDAAMRWNYTPKIKES